MKKTPNERKMWQSSKHNLAVILYFFTLRFISFSLLLFPLLRIIISCTPAWV